MSTREDEEAEARFEAWNEVTRGGTKTELSKEDIDFLNKIDSGYVGITRPKVEHRIEQSNEIPINQALVEDGDYMPVDAQGWE